MNTNDTYCVPLQEFVRKNRDKIEREGLTYIVRKDEVRVAFEGIKLWTYNKMVKDGLSEKEAKEKSEKKALTHIREALRFMSFNLADNANHEQAKAAAYLNNHYRTKYWKAEKKTFLYVFNVILGLCTGYLERPLRLLITVIVAWLTFAFLFWFVSAITSKDYTSIAFDVGSTEEAQSIEIYHYGYFSAVTLTTLGYGDISPNHSDSHKVANFIIVFLCSIEALLGYVILGVGVAILMRFSEGHPFGNMGKWIKDYERRTGI